MITITYSRRTSPSARLLKSAIEEQGYDVTLTRSSVGDVNWGRNYSTAELNTDISHSTNKRLMRELFSENGVPMPRLYSVSELSWSSDYPVVGRPDRHSKGRGFWLCRNYNDVRRALNGTRLKRAATHFMEFVPAPREYRVHIFNGRSIRISEKAFGETGETADGEYVTKRPDPDHNIAHVRQAAKDALEATGLDFGCADVLADDENCWVTEVNSAPHLGGSLPRVYAEKIIAWYEENNEDDDEDWD